MGHLIEYREKLLRRGHPPDHEAIIALEEQIAWGEKDPDRHGPKESAATLKRVG